MTEYKTRKQKKKNQKCSVQRKKNSDKKEKEGEPTKDNLLTKKETETNKDRDPESPVSPPPPGLTGVRPPFPRPDTLSRRGPVPSSYRMRVTSSYRYPPEMMSSFYCKTVQRVQNQPRPSLPRTSSALSAKGAGYLGQESLRRHDSGQGCARHAPG